jgi:hypothetical protein
MSDNDRDIEANAEGIEMSNERRENAPLLEDEQPTSNQDLPPSSSGNLDDPIQKPYEPIRTEPLKAMDTRKRRLDRVTDESIPEVHIVGQIKAGSGIVQDLTEGSFCR